MRARGGLEGFVAVITGAARGIGRACAIRFAQEGARLVLLDVAAPIPGVPYALGTSSQLSCTEELCRAEGAIAQSIIVDVRDPLAVDRAMATTLTRFGRIDILVNSAGIAAPSGKATHEIDEEEWRLMLDVDLTGTWRMVKAVSGSMLQRRSGSIINIASTAGVVGYRHFAGYVAAKHGVVGLTKAAALDFGPYKVRVNAICPGSVRDDPELEGCMLSEIARSLSVSVADHEQTFIQAQPMNALVEASDISAAAAWLGSPDARHVTGAIVMVDGGFSAR
jgi:NAD(P)-dependent dehydrogenase (short-subunit alcohol dehydrogenase family)